MATEARENIQQALAAAMDRHGHERACQVIHNALDAHLRPRVPAPHHQFYLDIFYIPDDVLVAALREY